MHKSLYSLAFFLLLFSVSAQAISVDAPSTIVVEGKQMDVPITISNDSSTEQEYSAFFFAPFNANLSPSFGKLGSGKSTILSLSIAKEQGLEGSSYESMLEVEIGEEKAFKNIKVVFKESEESVDEGNGEESSIGTGLFSFADFSAFSAAIFSTENMLNAFLALVAAILLIAFISRLVKRLEAKQ